MTITLSTLVWLIGAALTYRLLVLNFASGWMTVVCAVLWPPFLFGVFAAGFLGVFDDREEME
jgi:hypothetical protein